MEHLYLTAAQPGIGGQLKTQPEDFIVEEIPLYPALGEGQHTYIEIEKRDLTTHAAIKMIAQALHIPARQIGYAGLKDAHAVTRQTLSIDSVSPEAVAALDWPNLHILSIKQHRNKLKIGHLAGNRFTIRVRGVEPDSRAVAETIITRLSERGVPNYFGVQRFGTRANTHRLGELMVRQNTPAFIAEYLGRPQSHESMPVQAARHLVDEGRLADALAQWPRHLGDERRVLQALVKSQGDVDAAFKVLDKKIKSLLFSGFQSYLFNQLLVQRIRAETFTRLEVGDIAYLHHNGAAFTVVDATVEQPRADSFEISPAGPLFGPKMLPAMGAPGQREQAILDEQGLTPDDFKVSGLKLSGGRRPYRFKLQNAQIGWDEGLVVSFELQPGAYATTVMAEIMK